MIGSNPEFAIFIVSLNAIGDIILSVSSDTQKIH